jgi:hypothetical protein
MMSRSKPSSQRHPSPAIAADLLRVACLLATCLVAIGCVSGQGDASRPASMRSPEGSSLDCEPMGTARPICGFENPEDMVPLPGNEALLIGEYGNAPTHHSGALVVFELASEAHRPLYRGGQRENERAEAGWGDPACVSPPDPRFNSHGIDLVERDDGRLALLVVQHGSREAVEFFEVTGSGVDWRVDWRGCVESPADASLNEVVGLPDGSFYATKMASLSLAADLTSGFPTTPTGEAYHWTPEHGFRAIGGTEGIIPNGIAASPDARFVYMNASGESSIRKVEVATGREIGRAQVAMPDNVTWSPDGHLLVASLRAVDPEQFDLCQHVESGPCPMPFAIVAVDPERMEVLGTVYENQGRPMGAGTVGLQVGRELFVGSFQGDRILRIELDAKSGIDAVPGSASMP